MSLIRQKIYTFERIKAPRPQDKVYSDATRYPLLDISCQTEFRESEAQTVPWMPPYRVLQTKTPEVLTLACLSFDNGLQVTKQDVDVLLRLRKKREWENYLSKIFSPSNQEFRMKIIMELEKNEWEYREKEIGVINDLRMKLAQEEMLEQRTIVQERINYRMKRAREKCEMEKRIKLPRIQAECNRALRRSHQRLIGLHKHKKQNIIDKFTNFSSSLYAPPAGKNPASLHEKLCVDTLPKLVGDIYGTYWKSISSEPLHLINERNVKPHNCRRMQFYTMPSLIPSKPLKSYDRVEEKVRQIFTKPLPCSLGENDHEDMDLLRSTILLQSIIKGRAVQSMVLRQLKSHRDLVRELNSTIGLYEKSRKKKSKARREILKGIRDFNIAMQKKGKVIGLIEKLEGHTISTLLDYASKALIRLEDQKRAHLFALTAEQDRCAREFAEAGRRQQEEIRQRQHEEMYKQILKMHEITTDVFLEQTVEEQVRDTSKTLANVWVEKHAKEAEQIVDASQLKEFENMEYFSKLNSQFILDDIEKKKIRTELKTRTEVLRKYAEAAIYGKKKKVTEVDSSSQYSDVSAMRKMGVDLEEKQGKDWDNFYDKILEDSPEVKKLMKGAISKIQIYENPKLVKTLIKKLNQKRGKKREKIGKYRIGKAGKEENESSSSPEEDEIIIKDNEESHHCHFMDLEDVRYLRKFGGERGASAIGDSPSEVEGSEVSEKKITDRDLEEAERRRKLFEEEEQNKFFKQTAEKMLEEIIKRANAIAQKVDELADATRNKFEANFEAPKSEVQADALLLAYKVVCKALMKFHDTSYSDLKGTLEPWLDVVIREAEKRVFGVLETLSKETGSSDKKSEIKKEFNESDEDVIDITSISLEQLSINISEAVTEAHIFKGPPDWCAEIIYEEEKCDKASTSNLFTEEELSRLKYVGILDERKLTFVPDEDNVRKLPTVIKSRRKHCLDDPPISVLDCKLDHFSGEEEE